MPMNRPRRSLRAGALPIACLVLAGAAAPATPAHASLTLLPLGPQLGTHAGNLVTNGSFEIGGPGGAGPVYWATGTSLTPFGVPGGWTSSGGAFTYAWWGSDGAATPRTATADVLPDGQNGVYFGNGGGATVDLAPTFTPSRQVTFAGSPTFTMPSGWQVCTLAQTVPTHTNIAPAYILSFWVSGEGSSLGGTATGTDGIFGLRVTNVLPGDPMQYFAVPSGLGSAYGLSTRYEFTMTPLNPLAPIAIEFYNWGHLNLQAYGFPGQTEIVLDDVIVNAVPGPGSLALCAAGGAVLMRRRRRV